MKFYIKALLLVSFAFSLQNCEKDVINDIQINEISTGEVKMDSPLDGFTVSSVDGYILMKSVEYIGSCAPRSLDMTAVFNKGEDRAGRSIVQGVELPRIIENDKTRYHVSESPAILENILLTGKIDCEFNVEQIDKYISYSRELPFPDLLCAETSIESDDFFPKSEDLTITWNTDKNTDKLYVAVCAAGSPCFLSDFPDTGTLTIPSSEFSSFQSGQPVFIYIGRGIADVIEQSNNVKIALIRANWANFPGLIVE